VNATAEKELKRVLKRLIVVGGKQKRLRRLLKSRFSHNYLHGYFEAIIWLDGTITFFDYNRIIPSYLTTPLNPKKFDNLKSEIRGFGSFKGKTKGRVCRVNNRNINFVNFPSQSVLVCENTDVRYVSFMEKAVAIVTDKGGILSHAAIIAREMNKPFIVGTKIATSILKNGDLIEVDTDEGIVKIIK